MSTVPALDPRTRLELVDRILSAVSHDFNNVLATVSMYAELVLMDASLTAEAEADMQEILDAARRGAALTAFLGVVKDSRSDSPEPRALAVELGHLQKILGRLLPEEVSVRVDVPTEGVTVEVDRVRFQQAVFALVWEAHEAMGPTAGDIRIGVRDEPDAVHVDVDCTGSPDAPALDTPADDGLLAAVAELMERSGGRMESAAGPDGGIRRTLVFSRASSTSDAGDGGRTAAVVVIGDPALARLVKSAGRAVIEVDGPAADTAEAIAEPPGPGPNMVVSPATHPVFELVRADRARGRSTAFLLVGAAVDVELPGDLAEDPRVWLLRSPVSASRLAEAIGRAESSAAGDGG